MNNEFEKIYSKMDAYMKDKNVTDENVNELMKEFLKQYNGGNLDLPDTPLDKAMAKFDEAVSASSEKKAVKLAKEAIEIDPTYIDPKLFLIPIEYKGETLLKKLDEVIAEEKERLAKEKMFENAGEFYTVWQTRPYMRALQHRVIVLVEYGKVKKAQKQLENMLDLDNDDHLGARHLLAAVYAYFEDEKNMKKLVNDYKGDDTLSFLLPQLCLAYKLDQTDKTLALLSQIKKNNPYFEEVITSTDIDEEIADMLEEYGDDYFQIGDKSEVLEVIISMNFLINTAKGLIQFIKDNYK